MPDILTIHVPRETLEEWRKALEEIQHPTARFDPGVEKMLIQMIQRMQEQAHNLSLHIYQVMEGLPPDVVPDDEK